MKKINLQLSFKFAVELIAKNDGKAEIKKSKGMGLRSYIKNEIQDHFSVFVIRYIILLLAINYFLIAILFSDSIFSELYVIVFFVFAIFLSLILPINQFSKFMYANEIFTNRTFCNDRDALSSSTLQL
jgi:hypothetical protein